MTVGPDTILTYVYRDTLSFKDNGFDLEGRPLEGAWYYRVTAVGKSDGESPPTTTVKIEY